MPNCFSLSRKADPKAGPVALQLIDKEMCEHFQVRCDDKEWHHGWYNYIGFLIAMGKTWDWLKQDMHKSIAEASQANDEQGRLYWEHMLAILVWLEENFTPDAWAEIGR